MEKRRKKLNIRCTVSEVEEMRRQSGGLSYSALVDVFLSEGLVLPRASPKAEATAQVCFSRERWERTAAVIAASGRNDLSASVRDMILVAAQWCEQQRRAGRPVPVPERVGPSHHPRAARVIARRGDVLA